MLDTHFWKKYFKTYDVLNLLIPYQELLDTIVKSAEIKAGDVVLDAGAGTGNLSIKLKDAGARVIALDYSKEGLECLRLKDISIEAIKHDLLDALPFADNHFDKVVSNNVIYLIEPSKRLFVTKEFYRVLKPGGKIVLSNLMKGWNPIIIYREHLYKDMRKIGMMKLFFKILRYIIPCVKIFYYNFFILKEGKNTFLEQGKQHELLRGAGFSDLGPSRLVYAGQAMIDAGCKI